MPVPSAAKRARLEDLANRLDVEEDRDAITYKMSTLRKYF